MGDAQKRCSPCLPSLWGCPVQTLDFLQDSPELGPDLPATCSSPPCPAWPSFTHAARAVLYPLAHCCQASIKHSLVSSVPMLRWVSAQTPPQTPSAPRCAPPCTPVPSTCPAPLGPSMGTRLRRSPGEGNGNPLQCSCLENPRDGGAWWAAVYGVAQSPT